MGYYSLKVLDIGWNTSLNSDNLKKLIPEYLRQAKLEVLNCVHTDIGSDVIKGALDAIKVKCFFVSSVLFHFLKIVLHPL